MATVVEIASWAGWIWTGVFFLAAAPWLLRKRAAPADQPIEAEDAETQAAAQS